MGMSWGGRGGAAGEALSQLVSNRDTRETSKWRPAAALKTGIRRLHHSPSPTSRSNKAQAGIRQLKLLPEFLVLASPLLPRPRPS